MMKKPDIKFKDGHYLINQFQSFYVDHQLVNKHLMEDIRFPVVIMDTEFFNRSHDQEKLKKNFTIKKNLI